MKKSLLTALISLFTLGCGVSPVTPTGFTPGIYKGTVYTTAVTSTPSMAPSTIKNPGSMTLTVDNSGQVIWMGTVVEKGSKITEATSGAALTRTIDSCTETPSGISVTYIIDLGYTFSNGSPIVLSGTGTATFQFKDGAINFYESFTAADTLNTVLYSYAAQGTLYP